MSKFKDINWIGLFVYFVYPIAMMIFIVMLTIKGCEKHFGKTPQAPDAITKVDTVSYYDTIPYYMPVPRDSVVLRYVSIPLPAVIDTFSNGNYAQNSPEIIRDSDSTLLIPIKQRHYVDTTYEAWVSGFQPSLDSIRIFRQCLTVTKTVTKQKRWSYGLQGGIYLTPRGFQPGIGVGVTYTFPP